MRLHQLMIDGANRRPDKCALHWIDRDRKMTYAEAAAAINRVAGALASLGVGKGDRVGIFAHNGLDYVLAMFGAWRLGAISAHINVQYADTLDYYLNDCTPRVLIYTHDHLSAIERSRALAKSVQHYVCFDGLQDGALDWGALLAAAPAPPPDSVSDADPAHLSYTSGTSGAPKGAVLAHEPTNRACRCIAERLSIGSHDYTYGPSTLSSSYHLVANLLPGIYGTATVGIVSRWDAVRAWDDMDRLSCTVIPTNATILGELLEECRRRGGPPRRLRVGVSGGGPVPPTLKRAWRDELKLTLAESYGQSELGGFVGLGPLKRPTDEQLLACGPSLPDRDVRIIDRVSGKEAPVGQVGEIAVAGGCMVGYWGRPDKTAEAIRDGWLFTGDVGRMDADGYVYVRGRTSERLTVDGEAWYPRDVEEALMEHAAVRAAALIGLPHPTLGESPRAYVVLRNGTSATPTELIAYAEGRVGRRLSLLDLQLVASLPMTPTGKISKSQLRDHALRGP